MGLILYVTVHCVSFRGLRCKFDSAQTTMASLIKFNSMQKGNEATLFALLSCLAAVALSCLPAAPVNAVEPASDLAAYVYLHVTRHEVIKPSIVCANAPRNLAAAPYLQP